MKDNNKPAKATLPRRVVSIEMKFLDVQMKITNNALSLFTSLIPTMRTTMLENSHELWSSPPTENLLFDYM